MDKIKLSKNFTLSRESMKATLAAFKANKSVADVTREVFHIVEFTLTTRRATPKKATRELVTLSEPAGSSSKEGIEATPLDIQLIQAMGARLPSEPKLSRLQLKAGLLNAFVPLNS